MKIKRYLAIMCVGMLFFIVGCGANEKKGDDSATVEEQVSEELKEDSIEVTTEIVDGNFFVGVKSKHDKKVDLILKEDEKVVFEGEVSKTDKATKIYNITKNAPQKDCKYELVVSDGKTKLVKIFTTNDIAIEDKVNSEKQDEDKKNDDEDSKKDTEEDVNLDEVLNKYKEWDDKAVKYKKDDTVKYKGRLYECLQEHTSQTAWNPKEAVSLWVEFKE